MKLKYIRFIFENCDSIVIDGKYVGHFLVDDIHTSFSRIACNAFGKLDVADTFVIEIHKYANQERYEFDLIDDRYKEMTFDRFVKYNDITHIEFKFLDECSYDIQTYKFCLNWEGESDYTNEAQKVYVSKEDNLYVVVSKDKGIDDYFDAENIDDKKYMDFHFKMLDVGNE